MFFVRRLLNRHLPVAPRHDDLYLVEFPRSGITWLSFVVANLVRTKSCEHREVGFGSINDYIADVGMSRHVAPLSPGQWPNIRIIKSHEVVNPDYTKVIYLVRDPRKVMESYYRYRCGLGEYQGTFSQFIRDRRYGLRRWAEHVRGWIWSSRDSQRLQYIRYEDLQQASEQTICGTLGAFGIRVGVQEVAEALNAATVERMKELEEAYKSRDPRVAAGRLKQFKFVRSGETAAPIQWSEADNAVLSATCREVMTWFGYR